MAEVKAQAEVKPATEPKAAEPKAAEPKAAEPKADAKPADAKPAEPKVEEEKRVRNPLASKLLSTPRRRKLIDYYMGNNVVGHPDLLPIRLVERQITHDAYAKLDLGSPQPDELIYFNSDSYLIPKQMLPRDSSRVGGGPTGIIEYHFLGLRTEPGCYMTMAAAECALKYIAQRLVRYVETRASRSKKNGGCVLQWEHVDGMLSSSEGSFERFVSAFAAEWYKKVKTHDVPSKKGNGLITRKWEPLAIEWPVAQPQETHRRLIEKIVSTRQESMRARGKELYEKMIKEGKFKPKAKKEAAAATAEEKGKEKTKRRAPTRSALDLAVAKETKKERETNGAPRKPKIWEKSFDVSEYTTQKTLINGVLDAVPGSAACISKIAPVVRRFFDDLYIRLLLTIAETAVQFMAVAATTTMSPAITGRAIKTFFLALSGGVSTQLQRDATMAANEIASVYASKKSGGDDDEDDEDEEDDAPKTK